MVHTSATKQVTGTAAYIDDIPKVAGELAAAIVPSTVAHGRIISVDSSEALKVPGVRGYVNADDVPKSHHGDNPNLIGPVVKGKLQFIILGNFWVK
jgi:xanthine dehydrogenase molybdopterin-binding subunit B